MKKKINYARITWVVCLFLFLIVILLMVMDYKINYQYLKHNYLYFYECSGDVCVTTIKDEEKLLYNTYDCEYNKCPEYKKNISDDYALLNNNNENILYNYRKNIVVSKIYDDYEFIDSQYIIVRKNDLYGIINVNGKEIIKPTYEEIGTHFNSYLTGYNSVSIIAKKNNKYGLLAYRDGKMLEEFKYTSETLEELMNIMKSKE